VLGRIDFLVRYDSFLSRIDVKECKPRRMTQVRSQTPAFNRDGNPHDNTAPFM
jgi:hypothetical protein